MRELMQQTTPDNNTRDIAAFIALALLQMHKTIDTTVAAWEKRDYWIKADKFRMERDWTGRLGEDMKQALCADDWAKVALTSAAIGQKLAAVDAPKRSKLESPWTGAWLKLKQG